MITNLRHLRHVLRLSKEEFESLISDVSKHYRPYKKVEIKKDGSKKEREIWPSVGRLKEVQRIIDRKILRNHPLPEYVLGGVKGKDTIRNALAHKGYNHHFCLDLKNFFPSVKTYHVNKTLLKLGYSPEVASVLTKLVTVNGCVPQGAPSSTTITNHVFHLEVEHKLEDLIEKNELVYTRWIDDLNFSSQNDFQSVSAKITDTISSAFKINRKKTFYKQGKIEITGCGVTQNSIFATSRLKDKVNEADRNEQSKAGLEMYIDRIFVINKDVKRFSKR